MGLRGMRVPEPGSQQEQRPPARQDFAGFCQTSAAARPKHDTSISYEPKGSLKSTLSGRIPTAEGMPAFRAAIMTLSEQIEDLWINA